MQPFFFQTRLPRPRTAFPEFSRALGPRRGNDRDSPQGGAERGKYELPKGGRRFTKRLGIIVTKEVAY